MTKNALIAQSGGPTCVINNSLRGIIDALTEARDKAGTIYGGLHGIEGVLCEELLDLSAQDKEEIALLRSTPASGSIGTCRYKLSDSQEEDMKRIVDVLRGHNIGYFFYIGGNDSQHTAMRVSEAAREAGLDVAVTGVPKTIDNDLGDDDFALLDHSPGYGSIARYWSHAIQNANEENSGSSPSDPVLVIQTMGRKIGFIPAAARLADPGRELPIQIYMPEAGLTLPEMADRVNECIARAGRCIAVVSEGFEVGDIGELKDSFGHTTYASSATSVAQVVVSYLNKIGLKARGAARGQIAGTEQRTAMAYASVVDLEEAYMVGRKAVEIAMQDGSGYMATIHREPGPVYSVRYGKVPLESVALRDRAFPRHWISKSGIDVTDDYLRYAKPLIGSDWVSVPIVNGRQRFASIKQVLAPKKLPLYVPEAYKGR